MSPFYNHIYSVRLEIATEEVVQITSNELEWLKINSGPRDEVSWRWRATFDERLDYKKAALSDHFKIFVSLREEFASDLVRANHIHRTFQF